MIMKMNNEFHKNAKHYYYDYERKFIKMKDEESI